MIKESQAIKLCKDYTLIENYEEAKNDPSQVWVCHHILGEILTRRQLLDHDFYYDVPPCMLKFVTRAEHIRLHTKGKHLTEEHRRKLSGAKKGKKGKHLSDETRRKISEAMKGENHPLFGQHLSVLTRRKISEAKKGENNPLFGKHHSEETRKKMSESLKGKHHSEESRKKMSEAAKRRWARKRESISHRESA